MKTDFIRTSKNKKYEYGLTLTIGIGFGFLFAKTVDESDWWDYFFSLDLLFFGIYFGKYSTIGSKRVESLENEGLL